MTTSTGHSSADGWATAARVDPSRAGALLRDRDPAHELVVLRGDRSAGGQGGPQVSHLRDGPVADEAAAHVGRRPAVDQRAAGEERDAGRVRHPGDDDGPR